MATYTGIRSDLDITKSLKLYDADLIYSDLMNIFNTLPYSNGKRANQRVRMPAYGSYLKLYLFESNTALLQRRIKDEAVRIVSLDPRITLRNVQVFVNNHTVTVQVDGYLQDIGIDKILSFNFIRS